MKSEFLSFLQTSLKKAVCLQTNPNKADAQSGLLRHKQKIKIVLLHGYTGGTLVLIMVFGECPF